MKMKEIKLENATLNLLEDTNNVRIKSGKDNIVLNNQNIESVATLVRNNFDIVYNYYKSKSTNNTDLIDINKVSVSIVLHYLYIYNTWKNTYKNKTDLDLRFNKQDLNNPTTLDIIMSFYRKKYAINWIEKCNLLLGMTVEELQNYYEEREKFYNK